jgi:hypothetical protein
MTDPMPRRFSWQPLRPLHHPAARIASQPHALSGTILPVGIRPADRAVEPRDPARPRCADGRFEFQQPGLSRRPGPNTRAKRTPWSTT